MHYNIEPSATLPSAYKTSMAHLILSDRKPQVSLPCQTTGASDAMAVYSCCDMVPTSQAAVKPSSKWRRHAKVIKESAKGLVD